MLLDYPTNKILWASDTQKRNATLIQEDVDAIL